MKAKKIFTAGKKMRFLVLILLALVLIAAAPLLLYATLFRWDAPLERRTLAPLNEAAIEVLSQEFQVALKDEDTATVTQAVLFEDKSFYGFGNKALTITIEGTSMDAFLSDHAEEFREIRDRGLSSCRVVAKNGDILWITEEENRVILKKEEIRRATKTWFHENPAVKLEVIEPA